MRLTPSLPQDRVVHIAAENVLHRVEIGDLPPGAGREVGGISGPHLAADIGQIDPDRLIETRKVGGIVVLAPSMISKAKLFS